MGSMTGHGAPRRSCRQTRDASEHEAQGGLNRAGRWQVDTDLRPPLDDAGRHLDQAQPQGVELAMRQSERFGMAVRRPHRSQ